MRGFTDIEIPVKIGNDRAAYGRNADRLLPQAHFINSLGHQPVGYPVTAAGAIMGISIPEASGTGKDFFHIPI
jgi:hypothetical protein